MPGIKNTIGCTLMSIVAVYSTVAVAAKEQVTLEQRLVKSTWLFNDNQDPNAAVTYLPDGVVSCPRWQPQTTGTWSVINDHTIDQIEPGGNHVRITFDDKVSVAVWDYSNGDVAHAKRIKGS